MISRRGFIKAGLSVVLGLSVYSFIEPLNIEVNYVNLDLDLGLRILHVTDTHFHGVSFYEDELCNIVSKYSKYVDLTVLTGDIHDEFTPSLSILERFLSCIHSDKIFIYGNHEHYAMQKYSLKTVRKIYESNDTVVLANEAIDYKGVRIGGIDWWYYEKGLGERYLDMIGDVDILLSHPPDTFRLGNNHAILTLAGHTHGGQICIPFIGPIWVPGRYGRKYASGLFHEDGKYLYVSRGLGEVIPIRFNCRRELVILNL